MTSLRQRLLGPTAGEPAPIPAAAQTAAPGPGPTKSKPGRDSSTTTATLTPTSDRQNANTSTVTSTSTSTNVQNKKHLHPFARLPPEIHILISKQLTYPDALSLKHTNRYFYNLVDTGVKLKIDWLVERRTLHLECPNHGCDLGSDLQFCRGSVRLLMQRRREHMECESRPGLGCLVYGTPKCNHPPKLSTRVKRWLRIEFNFTVDLRWVLLGLVPLLLWWLCGVMGIGMGVPTVSLLGDW